MRVTLLNLTSQGIKCSWETPPSRSIPSRREEFVASPSSAIETELPRRCQHISLRHHLGVTHSASSNSGQGKEQERGQGRGQGQGQEQNVDASTEVKPAGIATRISLTLSALWHVLDTPKDSPWRVYATKVARKHYKLTVFLKRDTTSFLSDIPDTVPLYSLLLPGTHDTMAFYGWPISQCQYPSTPLQSQLESGIRVIDIRLALVDNRLIAYHGIYPERTPFSEILETINAFLTSPSSNRETIVMSMKQEDYSRTPPSDWSKAVKREIEESKGGLGLFFLENRMPKLGEVRGKVVMLSRFGGNGDGWEGGLEGLGIHPTTWPDSKKEGFEWDCKGVRVRMHDWYAIPSFLYIPEKVALATEILLAPPKEDLRPTLSFTYFSAASFPLATPPTIAQGFGWPKWGLGVEGVNSRVARWLLGILGGDSSVIKGVTDEGVREKEKLRASTDDGDEQEPRIRGWAMLDYYSSSENGLVPLLIECNFRGRKEGEEGWCR
ncbi:PLC-like phosphodiesterase [Dendrothele bispora CBS 962.96]|uniref:PLC-like phosphodiesterase n=1 Tax=Dendrothele bispora (strain CBS 962.96) TaxID=1314807 RepID=A0A4S8MXI0_DENBC|nr:PLC-like phosphodiesterase [Dendrothele bispora CBS 962.96]